MERVIQGVAASFRCKAEFEYERLAPLVIKDIFESIKKVNQTEGTTVLLVEQNAKIALATADRGYVLKNGDIVMEDKASALMSNPDIRAAYLGEKK